MPSGQQYSLKDAFLFPEKYANTGAMKSLQRTRAVAGLLHPTPTAKRRVFRP
jgi:hypothetical protein